MRREKMVFLICMITGVFTCGALAAHSVTLPNGPEKFSASQIGEQIPLCELDEDSTVWTEDFEGENNWETFNYNPADPSAWHTDEWNAYEDGTSWWCGTDDVGGEGVYGYDNAWLQFLDTPVLDFSDADASLTLELVLSYGSEDGIPGQGYEGYDGWDGGSVFVSTDGENWSVLENPSHAYNAESLYAFFIRGWGENIAGWRDVSDGWVDCDYDLSDYVGEATVTFRFAFASDNGVNTIGHLEWIGFLIDDILISDDDEVYLENDAEGVAEPSDLIPIPLEGCDATWVLQTDEYHSENHAWYCPQDHDVFSVIISPEIQLIEDWRHFLTYWVWCDLPDSDGDGDNTLEDYYQIQISDDGGEHWNSWGYDYGFNGSEEGWVLRDSIMISGAGFTLAEIPSQYSGESIMFRIRVITDDNDDGGAGQGVYLDDLEIIANSGWDHDVGIETVFIPFPTSVGTLIPAYTQIRNFGNNEETFGATWREGAHLYPLFIQATLQPGDSVRAWMDNDDEDDLDGWIPETFGTTNVYSQCVIFDDFPDNDLSPTYPVDVRPEGLYELGYDDRIVQYAAPGFETGEGPLTHFFIPDYLENFNLDSLRVLWNGNFGDSIATADVVIHIFEGGDEPGAEIFTETVTVEAIHTYQNWHEIDISGNAELEDMTGDFWLWYELTHVLNDNVYPFPLYSPRTVGDGHHYEYDGETITDADADWFIRAIGSADMIVGIDQAETPVVPSEYALASAFPNPFNPSTMLRFDLPRAGMVRIVAYNLMGREVARIVEGGFAPGSHTAEWNAEGLASGLYFISMEADEFQAVLKVTLLR